MLARNSLSFLVLQEIKPISKAHASEFFKEIGVGPANLDLLKSGFPDEVTRASELPRSGWNLETLRCDGSGQRDSFGRKV